MSDVIYRPEHPADRSMPKWRDNRYYRVMQEDSCIVAYDSTHFTTIHHVVKDLIGLINPDGPFRETLDRQLAGLDFAVWRDGTLQAVIHENRDHKEDEPGHLVYFFREPGNVIGPAPHLPDSPRDEDDD